MSSLPTYPFKFTPNCEVGLGAVTPFQNGTDLAQMLAPYMLTERDEGFNTPNILGSLFKGQTLIPRIVIKTAFPVPKAVQLWTPSVGTTWVHFTPVDKYLIVDSLKWADPAGGNHLYYCILAQDIP